MNRIFNLTFIFSSALHPLPIPHFSFTSLSKLTLLFPLPHPHHQSSSPHFPPALRNPSPKFPSFSLSPPTSPIPNPTFSPSHLNLSISLPSPLPLPHTPESPSAHNLLHPSFRLPFFSPTFPSPSLPPLTYPPSQRHLNPPPQPPLPYPTTREPCPPPQAKRCYR